MSVLDKFLNAIRLNDDYDEEDEFFDSDDDIDEDDFEEEAPKSRKRFFQKMKNQEEEEERREPKKTAAKTPSFSVSASAAPRQPRTASSPKVTPMRRKASPAGMEVCVIKPNSMEDTREIADTLLANCTVVLNLEGIDVEVAQRIIDFSCGACYSISGSLQKVSSYIFILTPASVEISGDIQDILNGAVPSIRTEF